MTKRILIVEDNEFIRNAYKMRLGKSQYRFEIAVNGQEALEIIPSFKPHVIVLDLIMPVMDGFTFMRQLKSDSKYSQIPIIIASSIGEDEKIQQALDLGAKDYIYKEEITLRDTLKKIDRFIKQPKS